MKLWGGQPQKKPHKAMFEDFDVITSLFYQTMDTLTEQIQQQRATYEAITGDEIRKEGNTTC